MPTAEQHLEMAREFILAQPDLDTCARHLTIQHHLKAAGIEFKKYLQGGLGSKINAVYSVVHGGEESQVKTIPQLLEFLR